MLLIRFIDRSGLGYWKEFMKYVFVTNWRRRNIKQERQVDIPIKYDGLVFDEGLRLDVLVGDEIICELKAVDEVNPVWEAQILRHLKLNDLVI